MLTKSAVYLSTGQAARRLGVSYTTIHALVRSGRLPAVSTPLGLLIPAEEVERLVQERQAAGEERR